jgi:hypothetical protein
MNENKVEEYHPPIFDTKCRECGKPLGPEVFLGLTCGKCCRKLHARAVGGSMARPFTRRKTSGHLR